MIKTALVAMTVMGCDCDAKLCEFISETPARYSTVADCEAAMKTRITQNSSYNYPLISGLCRLSPEPQPQLVSAPSTSFDEVPAGPSALPDATAQEGFYNTVQSGTRMVFRRTAGGYEIMKTGLRRIAGRTLDVVESVGRFIPKRLAGF